MAVDRDELFAKLEEMGEDEVRRRKEIPAFEGEKLRLVELWLDQQAEARSSAERREDIALAREANDTAHKANKIAIAAVVTATISAIAAIIAIVISLHKSGG